MNTFSFSITKKTDKGLLECLTALKENGPYQWDRMNVSFVMGGSLDIGKPDVESATPSGLEPYLELQSELISRLDVTFDSGRRLIFTRGAGTTPDKIELQQGNISDQLKWVRLVAESRRRLQALDAEGTIAALLDDTTRRHYEIRERELSRLQSITESLVGDTESYRKRKDEEYDERRKQLDQEYGQKREDLDAAHTKRMEILEVEEGQLKKRIQEVDDRGTRHARRQLRQDFKKVLETRSKSFELTKGTRQLRTPVFVLSMLLLAGFAAATAYTSAESYRLIAAASSVPQAGSNIGLLIVLALRPLTLAAAFGAAAVFFIRWQNQWFQQHAKEEFRLKRLDLDIDRASWLVEMLMEWKDEKGSGPPDALIERLAHNLFDDPESADEDLHPADTMARALFGSSSHLGLRLPLGEVEIDRKGLGRLRRIRAPRGHHTQ